MQNKAADQSSKPNPTDHLYNACFVHEPFNTINGARAKYVMRCAICYHLYNLKNVKNTHKGVLILIKLQAEACNFILKLTLLYGCFSRFLNHRNGTKPHNAPNMWNRPAKLVISRYFSENTISGFILENKGMRVV